jgi:hypothetical protein
MKTPQEVTVENGTYFLDILGALKISSRKENNNILRNGK